jgi:thiamine-monophosphate kinase
VVAPPAGAHQILTTDSLSYGQHFDASVGAREAGGKLVKRNLSDIAAMGGSPDYALLTLLSGGDLQIDWLAEFIIGIRETCKQYSLALVGGDISTLPDGQFISALSLTGHLQHAPLLRSGAGLGDALCVTGNLGGSILEKHYKFEPRLAEGQWLAQCGSCTALMDLTDGLGKDLRALLPANSSAHLNLEHIPLAPAAHTCAARTGQSAMEHAFCDGEDYELLFTLKKGTDFNTFERDWASHFPHTPVTAIGQLQPASGDAVYIDARTGQPVPWTQGFEHLSPR